MSNRQWRSGAEWAITTEADWLEEAVGNAERSGNYSAEYLKGCRAVVSWVRFHAEHPHLVRNRADR